jgi:hypothetical protein
MSRAVLLLAFGPIALLAARGGETIVVRRSDGSRTEVTRVGLDAKAGASLAIPGQGAATAPLAELISVEFVARPAAERSAPPAAVVLHDGSRLAGSIRSGDEENLTLLLARGGEIVLPIDAIRAVLVGPRAATLDLRRFTGEGDSLHRRTEVGGDSTKGTLVAFGQDGVRFEYSLGTNTFPWEEVEAVVLARQVDLEAPKAPRIDADLRPDGSLGGTLVRLDDQELQLLPAGFTAPVVLPIEGLQGIRFDGEGHRWLSDVAPRHVEQVPYLGSADDFLFPWRADRSVTGGPLVVHGRRYAKGFGCHSRTTMKFELDGSWKRFEAEVGISDEVESLPDPGAIEFRVLVDGEEKWRSRVLRGGEAAQPTGPIALDGAKSLELVTDFGAGEDVADRGVWGAPLLLR